MMAGHLTGDGTMLAFAINNKTLAVDFYPTRTMAQAQATAEQVVITSEDELEASKFGNGSLLSIHNSNTPGEWPTRFSDRKSAVRRTFKVLIDKCKQKFPDAAKTAEGEGKATKSDHKIKISEVKGGEKIAETIKEVAADPKIIDVTKKRKEKEAKAKAPATAKGKETAPAKSSAGRKGKRDLPLTVAKKDNPYRPGTQSFTTYKMILDKPGLTFNEYVNAGGRSNTIADAIRNQYLVAKE